MVFDKESYSNEFERMLKNYFQTKFFIRKSHETFKINSFIQKGTDSIKLAEYIKKSKEPAKNYWVITICYYSMLYLSKAAILEKGYETDDHYSTQIALGHLLVPDEIEKEDLEILEKTHISLNVII